jgi:hypothetical protein
LRVIAEYDAQTAVERELVLRWHHYCGESDPEVAVAPSGSKKAECDIRGTTDIKRQSSIN